MSEREPECVWEKEAEREGERERERERVRECVRERENESHTTPLTIGCIPIAAHKDFHILLH